MLATFANFLSFLELQISYDIRAVPTPNGISTRSAITATNAILIQCHCHSRTVQYHNVCYKSSAIADKRRHASVRLFVICSTVMVQFVS